MKSICIIFILLLTFSDCIFAQNIESGIPRDRSTDFYVPKGYRGNIEVGGRYGKLNDRILRYSDLDIFTTHGYQFSPYVFLGGGIGISIFNVLNENLLSTPLYAEVKINILKNKITPYVSGKIGYSIFGMHGFYSNPSIGVAFYNKNYQAIFISLGYTYQTSTSDELKAIDTYCAYHSGNLNVGFEF